VAKYTLDIDVNYKSVEDLKGELQALEAEFSTLSIGSKGFTELGNQIKNIKSQLKDVELQFEGLDKEQRATALVDTFNGLTGAVGAVSSAFIAFGAESQAIEDAEKKLLGVIGVVSGLRDVSNGLVAANKLIGPSFEALGTTIKAAMTTGTAATQTFKAALAALGIPLLIAGIVALVDAVSSLNEEAPKIQTAKEKYDDFNASISQGNSLLQARLGFLKAEFGETEAINEQLAAASADREKRNKKDIELRADLLYAEQDLQIAKNNNDKKEIKRFEDRKKEIQGLIDANFVASVALESQEKTLQKQLQKIKDDAKAAADKKAEDDAKKAKATRDARLKNEKDALLAEAESKRQLAIQLEDDEKKRRKLVLDDELADLKVASDAALAQENLTDAAKTAIRSKFNNDTLAAKDKFNNDIADIDTKAAEKAKEDAEKLAADLKSFQERAYNGELNGIKEFYGKKQNELTSQFEQGLITQEQYNAQLQQLETDRLNNILQATKDAGQSTVDIEKQILDQKIAIKAKDLETTKVTEQAKLSAQLEFAAAAGNAVSALAGLFEEGSNAAKTAALVDIAVGTGVGFIRALSIAQETAQATGPAAAFAFPIFYASQIAAVLGAASRAKAILSSGGSGGGGGSRPPIPSTPSVPSVTTSQGTYSPLLPQGSTETGTGGQTGTGGPGRGERVVKTYVLAGDVTDAQQAEAQINQKRKF
jgi:hypothetical protein